MEGAFGWSRRIGVAALKGPIGAVVVLNRIRYAIEGVRGSLAVVGLADPDIVAGGIIRASTVAGGWGGFAFWFAAFWIIGWGKAETAAGEFAYFLELSSDLESVI